MRDRIGNFPFAAAITWYLGRVGGQKAIELIRIFFKRVYFNTLAVVGLFFFFAYLMLFPSNLRVYFLLTWLHLKKQERVSTMAAILHVVQVLMPWCFPSSRMWSAHAVHGGRSCSNPRVSCAYLISVGLSSVLTATSRCTCKRSRIKFDTLLKCNHTECVSLQCLAVHPSAGVLLNVIRVCYHLL